MVFGTILVAGASLTASVLVVFPILFRYSKTLQRKMVFCNCVNYPYNLDYEDPTSCNIFGARNCCVEFHSEVDDCQIKIGIWHLIPCRMFKEVFAERDYDNFFKKYSKDLKNAKDTVVLYCHGNTNHRASTHRLSMYKVFQQLDFHVITYDYRGYGDSTPVRPTEPGVVEDCFYVYSWLMDSINTQQKPLIVLWGHSLGSAVAANFVSHLPELCMQYGKKILPLPDALVLEAPFNNLQDEIASHPFAKLVSWVPYYRGLLLKPFTINTDYTFATDEYLSHVPQIPCLILHSKADRIIPYDLAVKLHQVLLESRKDHGAPLVFHTFEKDVSIGHNNICSARDLSVTIRNFLRLVNRPIFIPEVNE